MESSSVRQESKRILTEHLLQDERLQIPEEFINAAERLTFTVDDDTPFLPSPCKMTESASALHALMAVAGSAIAADRYGIEHQEVQVNTDIASLSLFSVILPTVSGVPFRQNEQLHRETSKGDLHQVYRPLCAHTKCLYQTKDSRWYCSHGDLNPSKMINLLGIEDVDGISDEEARQSFVNKILQWDVKVLEDTANSIYHISGVECLKHEDFLSSETGKHMSREPLYTLHSIAATRSEWPAPSVERASAYSPLAGIKVIDFSRVIAAPVVSKFLAVLGAQVLKISWEGLPDHGFLWVDLSSGKRDTNLNLKTELDRKKFCTLLIDADVLVDGYRPGVLDRLGFKAEKLREINPKLIIVRENCYGWKGPLTQRSGWQPISDCLVGHAWLQGQFLGLDEPVLPPLPNSDMQTGYAGAAAAMQALYMRTKADVTFDIDLSLTQYNVWLYNLGQYTMQQQAELRLRNATFQARHWDRVEMLLQKTHQAVLRTRPDVFQQPDYFWPMDGREWGLDKKIMILAPAFKFERSKLQYAVPSGSRGRSSPIWVNGT